MLPMHTTLRCKKDKKNLPDFCTKVALGDRAVAEANEATCITQYPDSTERSSNVSYQTFE